MSDVPMRDVPMGDVPMRSFLADDVSQHEEDDLDYDSSLGKLKEAQRGVNTVREIRYLQIHPDELWVPCSLTESALMMIDSDLLRSASEIESHDFGRKILRKSKQRITSNSYARPIKSDVYLSIDGGFCNQCKHQITQAEFKDCIDVVGCAGCRRYFHKYCVQNPKCHPWHCEDCFADMAQCYVCREPEAIEILSQCSYPLCARFYHDKCLDDVGGFWESGLPDRKIRNGRLHKSGRHFICPTHFCSRCSVTRSHASHSQIPNVQETLSDPLLLVYCIACYRSFHLTCLDPLFSPLTLESFTDLQQRYQSTASSGHIRADRRLFKAVERVMKVVDIQNLIGSQQSQKPSPVRSIRYCLCERHDPRAFPGSVEAGRIGLQTFGDDERGIEETSMDDNNDDRSIVSPSVVSLRAFSRSMEELRPSSKMKSIERINDPSFLSGGKNIQNELQNQNERINDPSFLSGGKNIQDELQNQNRMKIMWEGPLKNVKFGLDGIPKNVKLESQTRTRVAGLGTKQDDSLSLPFYWIKRNIDLTGNHSKSRAGIDRDEREIKCECKDSCEFDSCRNAQTYVECDSWCCGLPGHRQKEFCHNRHFIRCKSPQLELRFISKQVGWGVFTRQNLPTRGFVAEYVGELITGDEKRARLEELPLSNLLELKLETVTPKAVGARSPAGRGRGRGKRTKESSPGGTRKRASYETPPGISEEKVALSPDGYPIPSQLKHHWYIMDVEAGLIIDSKRFGNISRLINHSCDPNCIAQKWKVRNESRVGIFALRPIMSGEQITYDYSFTSSGDGFECCCGTAKCRGRVGISRRVQALRDIRRTEDLVFDSPQQSLEKCDVVQAIRNFESSAKDLDGLTQFRMLRKLMSPTTVPHFIRGRSPRDMLDIVLHSVFAEELAPFALTAALFAPSLGHLHQWNEMRLKLPILLTHHPWCFLILDCGKEDLSVGEDEKLFLTKSHHHCKGNWEDLIAARFQILGLNNHPMWKLINEGLGVNGACMSCGLVGELAVCEICCRGFHRRCSLFKPVELFPSDGIFPHLFDIVLRKPNNPLTIYINEACNQCRINTAYARAIRNRRHVWHFQLSAEEKQSRYILVKQRQWNLMEEDAKKRQ